MTRVPRKFYGKVACNKQMQAYVFIENNALVPLEDSNYAIFYEPTKLYFKYSHQTMQLSQVRCDEINSWRKHLLSWDVILHQSMGTNDNIRQIQTPDHINRTDRQSTYVHVVAFEDKDQNVNTRQDDGLWVNVWDIYIETGQRKDFNDYKLVQDEYLKSLTMNDNLETLYLPDRSNIQNDRQTGHYSQAQRDKKIVGMSRLKTEIRYLERGMQGIRMTLAKLQQDPTQTSLLSRVGSMPKDYRSTRLSW